MPDLAKPEFDFDRGAGGQTLHGVLKRANGGAGGRDQFPVQLCFLRFAREAVSPSYFTCLVRLTTSYA